MIHWGFPIAEKVGNRRALCSPQPRLAYDLISQGSKQGVFFGASVHFVDCPECMVMAVEAALNDRYWGFCSRCNNGPGAQCERCKETPGLMMIEIPDYLRDKT